MEKMIREAKIPKINKKDVPPNTAPPKSKQVAKPIDQDNDFDKG